MSIKYACDTCFVMHWSM